MVVCKFFLPDAGWTWFAIEGSPVDGAGYYDTDKPKVDFLFFGLVSGLVLQLYFWACPPFVVPILGDALMPAAPRRPGQNPFHFLLRGQHKTPEETTNLADTQRHASPRVALNVAKLLGWEGSSVFFGSSGGRWAARSTVNSAYAHMAKVICRYHPVQLRTS